MKIVFIVFFFVATLARSVETNDFTPQFRALEESLGQLEAKLFRQMNELLWWQLLAEVATIDKVRFTGPPPHSLDIPTVPAGSNQVIISALTFLPRSRVSSRKFPLIVFAHSEIHGNLVTDEEVHVVRELVGQGYAVIAPDYRGSSGYGLDFWRQIDYGGLEIDDVEAARAWMIQNHREVDSRRVGIIGWSHGGLIALMTVLFHPNEYRVCYAGVPVADLEERIRIRGPDYEQLFSAPYHIGKTTDEAPEEYRRRSPAWNAARLQTPLLIQANTNDEDVKLQEVQRLITALRAAGKDFQYHLYTNAPGGHLFNRLDTQTAKESREEIWKFLAKHLQRK
jgi:dipeptidyl aminopeptidase/acylaminoacyl peptidase